MSADRPDTAPDVGLTEAERELLDGAVTEDFDHDYDHSNPSTTRTVERILRTRLVAAVARAEAAEAKVARVEAACAEAERVGWRVPVATVRAALAGPEET